MESLHAGDRDQYIWDFELPGFGVKVTPAGSRVYLVQYRIGGRKGRTRRVTIGRHGSITAEAARETAVRIKETINSGRDPAAEFGMRRAVAMRPLPTPARTLRLLREKDVIGDWPGDSRGRRSILKRAKRSG
ncbi:MAG TPA: Arm DNA-binding domain-containing protein [Alphaproteobacteria bacterium]